LLQDGAWLRHGAHANRMTQKLAAALRQIPSVKILVKPEVNAVFAEMPPAVAEGLKKRGWYFYSFIGAHGYRLMCSWDTRDEDIDGFVADLRAVLSSS
jgi:threonine aldolase